MLTKFIKILVKNKDQTPHDAKLSLVNESGVSPKTKASLLLIGKGDSQRLLPSTTNVKSKPVDHRFLHQTAEIDGEASDFEFEVKESPLVVRSVSKVGR